MGKFSKDLFNTKLYQVFHDEFPLFKAEVDIP